MTVYIAHVVSLTSDSEVPSHLARELRRADSFIRLGVLAAHEIIKQEGLQDWSSLDDRGLFIGSSYGPMEANMEVLQQVSNGEQTSPTLFSHSVFNGAAGYLSRIFKLKGCAVTITDFGFPFFQAIQLAISSIASGQTSSCLVLQIETFSKLLREARNTLFTKEPCPWRPGACAWLLTRESTSSQSKRIENFTLKTSVAQPETFLRFQEDLNINGEIFQLSSPLDAAHKISERLKTGTNTVDSFALSAPYGEILLTTSP